MQNVLCKAILDIFQGNTTRKLYLITSFPTEIFVVFAMSLISVAYL